MLDLHGEHFPGGSWSAVATLASLGNLVPVVDHQFYGRDGLYQDLPGSY